MDIVFAFDDGYSSQAPLTIESLLDSHSGSHDLRIWIVTTADVISASRDPLLRQVGDRAELNMVAAPDDFRSLGTSALNNLAYISAGAHLRLFIPDLLPSHVQRFLYLDVDVFVEGDLRPLWSVEFHQAIAAVRDMFNPNVDSQGGIPGAPSDLDGSAPYFNSGVMLVNRKAWLDMRLTQRCLKYLAARGGKLRFPGQDAVNLVCYKDWHELDDSWNFQGWWPDPGVPLQEPAGLRITHYLGRRKPWHADFPLESHRLRYQQLSERVVAWHASVLASAMTHYHPLTGDSHD